MSLILTRKPGEAILYRKVEKDGTVCYGRIYVVSMDGNKVRLALDAPANTELIRAELLPEELGREWTERAGGCRDPPTTLRKQA
jgi:sRNA-binding carbon storage regulator CsrA